MDSNGSIITSDDPILITGASGFIGSRVVESLLARGYRNLRCLARPSGDTGKLEAIKARVGDQARIDIIRGNLLSRADCSAITQGVPVIYHLAAGRGEKSYPDGFMNSVVTTRNLLDATLEHRCLKRLVSISSFSVYSNRDKPNGRWLDESCPMEERPEQRGDAYTFAKVRQDELVMEYGRKHQVPYVILRPGFVYGPGNEGITGRVGLGTFGIFLHLGGGNPIPFSYVDNCAEAIVLAGIQPGVDGEIFNVVDDDLPSSREFLRLYKREVKKFRSVYVPHFASYLLCRAWEKYSDWSQGQLPPAFNRKTWHAYWKKSCYTNEKLKSRLGWKPKVPTSEALQRYFESCRQKKR
jgi:nucleoside-diphosphate-sugar epimerase